MLKEIVLKQKAEKEHFLSLSYVPRIRLKEAQKWSDSDLIKVVLGPRRSGKSIFSLMLLKDKPFAYFNFDDENLANQNNFDYDRLMKTIHEVYGETKTILFDEIQNLPKWELFINRLHRSGYNIFLTGSNAKLLSKELATALTGRHIPIEILPFNLKEFLLARNYVLPAGKLSIPEEKARLLGLLDKFLLEGGYPEVVTKNLDSKGYLDVLFDSVLFKDIVRRHRIRFSEQIDNLGSYFINNFASHYSLKKTTNALNFKSKITLEKYLNYLTEAYIIFVLRCYSVKTKERIRSPKKVYIVDNGFINAKAVQHSSDRGKLMENLVFTELLKEGMEPNKDLFYYKTRNDREIDFVIKEGTAIDELIQVVYELGDHDTRQREIKALIEAKKELGAEKLTILTWDEKGKIEEAGVNINLIPIWERFTQ